MKQIHILLSLVFMLNGCAYMSQEVKIDPVINKASSAIGTGKSILLKVADERESKDMGRRTNAYNMGAMITNNQDLEETFKGTISAGLQNEGFTLSSASDSERILKIEIRSIEYTTSMGIMRGGFIANAALKAIAINGKETYEKMYRSSVDKKKVFLPTADANEIQINAAVSEALDKLFKDTELLNFLAK